MHRIPPNLMDQFEKQVPFHPDGFHTLQYQRTASRGTEPRSESPSRIRHLVNSVQRLFAKSHSLEAPSKREYNGTRGGGDFRSERGGGASHESEAKVETHVMSQADATAAGQWVGGALMTTWTVTAVSCHSYVRAIQAGCSQDDDCLSVFSMSGPQGTIKSGAVFPYRKARAAEQPFPRYPCVSSTAKLDNIYAVFIAALIKRSTKKLLYYCIATVKDS
uniref:Discs, largehomolog-associated protein 3 n=1 Tax=Nothobranchius korthausae TaxID=1143690 RepID=A0A1A8HK31_9TELE